MKNIQLITTLAISLLLTATVFGQHEKGKRPNKEKVKAMKIGYITEKVNLTSEEAQKFWPIYNEFESKMNEMRKKRKEAHKKETGETEFSDAEVEKIVDNHIVMEQKELDIKKEYHTKFKAVLPIKKVAKLYRANEGFKRDLLKRLKEHRGAGKKGEPQHKKRTSTDF
jgi:Spy/CpxP family protein refolding chaperone